MNKRNKGFDLNWIPTKRLVRAKQDERLADVALMIALTATFMILLGVLLYVEA